MNSILSIATAIYVTIIRIIMLNSNNLQGHLSALFTVSVWSVTYISTKYLLDSFTPIEILFIRFFMAVLALKVIAFGSVGFKPKEQIYFALAGFTGAFLYFFIENSALLFTSAVNVSIILSITPLFTALVTGLFYKDERKINTWFILGFIAAFSGIVLLSTKGADNLSFNPLGDFMAVSAGMVWAFYSVLTRKINSFGYSTPMVTRRCFEYGIIFMLPVMLFNESRFTVSDFTNTVNVINLLFLGLVASAGSFTTWNFAVKKIGAVTAIIYLYLTPVISALAADFFLNERLSLLGWLSCFIITMGVIISNGTPLKNFFKKIYGTVSVKTEQTLDKNSRK